MTTTDTVTSYLQTCDIGRTQRENTADALGMSSSWLGKKLKSEGTSFTLLLDAERRRRCENLMQINKRFDGPLLARITGYREVESARRSFVRWHGMGPLAWRRNGQR
jgi:AraC-like DNA-binding protein